MRHAVLRLLLAAALLLPTALAAQTTLTGTAHNVSVGFSDSVTMQITRNADGSYALTASFGMVNLFGEVTAIGYPPRYDDGTIACAQGHECIHFGGTLALDERSGFDPGTEAVFALHLDLDQTAGTGAGAYHIGPLPSLNFQQYGTIEVTSPIS